MSDDDPQFESPDVLVTTVDKFDKFLKSVFFRRPRVADDGACAHPEVDPLERCRLCNITMDEAAYAFRDYVYRDAQP
jgi:hypothetical protein